MILRNARKPRKSLKIHGNSGKITSNFHSTTTILCWTWLFFGQESKGSRFVRFPVCAGGEPVSQLKLKLQQFLRSHFRLHETLRSSRLVRTLGLTNPRTIGTFILGMADRHRLSYCVLWKNSKWRRPPFWICIWQILDHPRSPLMDMKSQSKIRTFTFEDIVIL